MFGFMQRFGRDSQARWRGIGPLARVRRRNHRLNCEALESRQLLSGYYVVNASSGKVLDDPGFSTSANAQIDQWRINGGANQKWDFVQQPDGRFRSQSLMPDHEYAITVRDPRGVYDLAPLQRISVPESGTTELSFFLRKRRKPPGAGETAPPFAVTTIEGQDLSLASLHGKTVLLHFWTPANRIGVPDAATLLAMHERFGSNKRFTMVGLCLSDRTEAATRVMQSSKLSWSQAFIRDGFYDPIAINYGALQPDATCLIGPDGKIIARGLQGTALEEALAEALAAK